jgi:hypothetical protein
MFEQRLAAPVRALAEAEEGVEHAG